MLGTWLDHLPGWPVCIYICSAYMIQARPATVRMAKAGEYVEHSLGCPGTKDVWPTYWAYEY